MPIAGPFRLAKKWFSSSDQLVHMIMGGEGYLGHPGLHSVLADRACQLGLQIAAHILSPFGIRPILDLLAQGKGGTPAIHAIRSLFRDGSENWPRFL